MGELSEELYHSANGCLMLCARREDKILPASVIRDKLDSKVRQIENAEDRRVYRKEKETLKEEIIFDCLPQAFTKSQRQYGFIDIEKGWLCIDSSSYTQAEAWIKLLRESLGSLPVVLLQTKESAHIVMTEWLKTGTLPEHLSLGGECELKEASEGGSIARLKNHDLISSETEAHLEAGKQVAKLGLQWNEQLQFTLQDDLAIKKLKFSETLVTEAQEASDGDKAAQFDADFALMTRSIQEFIPQLLAYFGGIRGDDAI